MTLSMANLLRVFPQMMPCMFMGIVHFGIRSNLFDTIKLVRIDFAEEVVMNKHQK